MKFGHFDDASREYVIERPDTPYPWINYLGTEDFFSLISNTAGGYCFYRDALLRRITRYRYNNIPTDTGGRYFYINDNNTIWTPGWMPVKVDLDHYECRHGLGYTTITGSYQGVTAELTCCVPIGHTLELQRLVITNNSDAAKSLKLFSFAEWCLWHALDDFTNFQRNFSIGEVEIHDSTIYHKTEYRERRNHFAYYSVNCPVQGFDTDREAFMGLYNGLHEPQAVLNGTPTNSIASGWSPIASHYIECDLGPGEDREYIFTLGYAENDDTSKFSSPGALNREPAEVAIKQFQTSDQVEAALDELKAYWDRLLSIQSVTCNDERLSRMVNIWNPYQCMITYHMSRSASFFESGIGRGMGFRDSNQDLLGVVHQIPERSRERILDIAATQLPDGGAYHQYQPLTKRGNKGMGDNFNDDPLWLIVSVCAYIRETGDSSILDEQVPYENDETLAAPLLDHLWRSFRFTLNNLGPHNLPLIGRADWNDCLNLNCFSTNPGDSFQTCGNKYGTTAESLMIAGLFCYAGDEFTSLLDFMGRSDEAQEVKDGIAAMRQAVTDHGRDPEWFLRAYDSNSNKVGSVECEDGQIFIESQGWCVMGGMGFDDGFARTALDAVKDRLDTDYGIVLMQPAYKDYHLELGEVTSYPPGYKENAGIFCHNNPWIMIAETMLGNAEQAFDYYSKICPSYLEEISEIHRTEPYVYSQMIAGRDAVRHGEAKNSWLTGTAGWNYVAITQHILGIRPGFTGLTIKPCVPRDCGNMTVYRTCRNTTFTITIRHHADGEETGLIVDGARIDGRSVPYPADKKSCTVEAIV